MAQVRVVPVTQEVVSSDRKLRTMYINNTFSGNCTADSSTSLCEAPNFMITFVRSNRPSSHFYTGVEDILLYRQGPKFFDARFLPYSTTSAGYTVEFTQPTGNPKPKGKLFSRYRGTRGLLWHVSPASHRPLAASA